MATPRLSSCALPAHLAALVTPSLLSRLLDPSSVLLRSRPLSSLSLARPSLLGRTPYFAPSRDLPPTPLTMTPLIPLLTHRQYQNTIWTDFLVQVCIRFTHSSRVSIKWTAACHTTSITTPAGTPLPKDHMHQCHIYPNTTVCCSRHQTFAMVIMAPFGTTITTVPACPITVIHTVPPIKSRPITSIRATLKWLTQVPSLALTVTATQHQLMPTSPNITPRALERDLPRTTPIRDVPFRSVNLMSLDRSGADSVSKNTTIRYTLSVVVRCMYYFEI